MLFQLTIVWDLMKVSGIIQSPYFRESTNWGSSLYVMRFLVICVFIRKEHAILKNGVLSIESAILSVGSAVHRKCKRFVRFVDVSWRC